MAATLKKPAGGPVLDFAPAAIDIPAAHYIGGRRVVAGEIFDVAVDVRASSPTYGKWVGEVLSAENKRQLWIPVGFAHGFMSLSEGTEVLYKATDFYHKAAERAVIWNDPEIAIAWPQSIAPILSDKDAIAPRLAGAETFA